MRKFTKIGVAIVAGAAVTVLSAGPATAGAAPPKVTGTIQIAPMIWTSFDAFPGSPVKGSITYTDFNAPAASQVFRLGSTVPIVFNFGGLYPHTLTVVSEKMLAYNSLQFSGNGVFDADHSFTFDAVGTITNDQIVMQVVYTGVGAGNTWNLNGQVAPDGSISGTATSPTFSSPDGTWTSPAGSAHSVLSYTTPVTCATVSGAVATFGFTIPQASGPPYANLPIAFKVQDGGLPSGQNPDRVWVDLAPSAGSCAGAGTTEYDITGGNLVVH